MLEFKEIAEISKIYMFIEEKVSSYKKNPEATMKDMLQNTNEAIKMYIEEKMKIDHKADFSLLQQSVMVNELFLKNIEANKKV